MVLRMAGETVVKKVQSSGDSLAGNLAVKKVDQMVSL
jgi:hypothetical protein